MDPQSIPIRTENRAAGQNEPYPTRAPRQQNAVRYAAQIDPFLWSSPYAQGIPPSLATGTSQGVFNYRPGRFDTVPGWPGNRPETQTHQASYGAGLNALVATQNAVVPQTEADMSSYIYLGRIKINELEGNLQQAKHLVQVAEGPSCANAVESKSKAEGLCHL